MTILYKYLFLSFFSFFCLEQVCGQEAQRSMIAGKRVGPIVIDGRLSDALWQSAARVSGFTQTAPRPGLPSGQRTEVSVLYDDEAIYVGAMLHETHPDSIVKQLSPRDEFENNNTDAFVVTFDTYYDRQNATEFGVTAAGVQADGIVKFDAVDRSWNAAWYSRVHHNDSGWSVEMKIPYSALRFSKKDTQLWGVNFQRVIRRQRERSYWNKVDPAVQNVICQSGKLQGITHIKAPVRLALLPYFSAYAQNYDGAGTNSINGGMDIKYGVSESFTLDMTLVPDFGQTLFDNKVLNLSAIEVRYDERRYFFTEGVDLFNKNDLFYSRRVGGTPINAHNLNTQLGLDEIATKNPATTRLYNATKFSGRTRGRTGIGIFNAVSAQTDAHVLDTLTGEERRVQTAPLTNYNVLVFDQALKNNSYISLVNTNVTRKDIAADANVSAFLFRFADRKNKYSVTGSTDVSQIYKSEWHYHDVGYRGALTLAKQSGNYTWSLQSRAVSDNFNPNDLGYLDRNNIVSVLYNNTYNTYKPFWKINNTYNKIGLEYYRAFNPNKFAKAAINGNHVVTFRNFFTAGFYWDAQPDEALDFYEPREQGRYYVMPANNMFGGFVSSDYRKKFALDLETSNRWFADGKRNTFYWNVSPRYRFSDKLSGVYSFSSEYRTKDVGFVNRVNDSIYLGTRSLLTTTNTLTMAYIFARNMSLSLNGRHYWSQADYSEFGLLGTDGRLQSTSYVANHEVNYNSFNVFMNFVWQFKPGSEMSLVYQNSIYSSGQDLANNYFSDLNTTLGNPQSNSLSLKVVYFLDYLTIQKAIRRSRTDS